MPKPERVFTHVHTWTQPFIYAPVLYPPYPDREKQLTEALRELKDLKAGAANWARDKKNMESQVRSGYGGQYDGCEGHRQDGRTASLQRGPGSRALAVMDRAHQVAFLRNLG